MGLDMYAYRLKRDPGKPFGFEDQEDKVSIAYWRKHPNLHGWMEQLYKARGGQEVFNTIALRLLPEDIDALEKAVTSDSLPETSGFFYGQSRPEDKDDDIAFIKAAREAFAEGDHICYYSWW